MKKNLITILCLIIINTPAQAGITYPYSIEYFDFFEGGKLHLVTPKNPTQNEPAFYFVKTSWLIDSETVYFWQGFQRNNSKGENINAFILDATYFQNKFLILIREENHFAITTFDSAFSQKNKFVLHTDTTWENLPITRNTHNLRNIRLICNPNSNKLFLMHGENFYEVIVKINHKNQIDDLFLLSINQNVVDCKFFEKRIYNDSNTLHSNNFNSNNLQSQNLNSKNTHSKKFHSSDNPQNTHSNDNQHNLQNPPNSNSSNHFQPYNYNYAASYIVDRREYALVYFLDEQSNSQYVARIPITDKTSVFPLQNYLMTANSTDNQSDVLLSVIDIQSKNVLLYGWLKANQNLMDNDKHSDNIFVLTNEKNNFKLTKIPALGLNNEGEWASVNLPANLCTPIKLVTLDNLIYIFFYNALVVYDNNLSDVIFDYYDFTNFANVDFDVVKYDDYIILSSASGSLILRKEANPLWFINRQIFTTYRYGIPIILIFTLLLIWRKYRNQKRLFDAIIELPSFEFVFFISRVGRLIKANEGGKQILDIPDNIPLGKQISYYCKTDMTQPIAEIIERGLITRMSFQQKINIVNKNLPREWLCSLIPLRNITGRFSGIILIGVDITEELERQMLTNWSQLAHDMQTNLSTIRLNAEQININSDDEVRIKNKIIQQVTILIQRVRDIVTVGRDDKLETSTVNSINFCNEVRSEFDDNVFSKIRFEMNLTDFNFICDKPKLLRAVRNAIENGIKAMKNNGGVIKISCNKDIHFVTISIRDTGIGMDENTRNKIFTPFYSTERKEGGYGIGTMIMQRVAELHGGKLLIESELNVGTEITFQLPDLSRKKQANG